jgi:hypothetical protein
MVAGQVGLGQLCFMLAHFGWKAALAVGRQCRWC